MMKEMFRLSTAVVLFFLLPTLNIGLANDLVNRVITLSSNERFDLLQSENVNFKFQPLSEDALKLEVTKDASSLGVAYLGQIKLKENTSALSALRSIADQIGESLDINFGVIADSNTSDALKANELLLLYHPNVTLTLALAKPAENSDYEIICTYVLKNLDKTHVESEKSAEKNANSSETDKINNETDPAKDLPTN